MIEVLPSLMLYELKNINNSLIWRGFWDVVDRAYNIYGEPRPETCTCDSRLLFRVGCKCGFVKGGKKW